jgi:hypothetical protein
MPTFVVSEANIHFRLVSADNGFGDPPRTVWTGHFQPTTTLLQEAAAGVTILHKILLLILTELLAPEHQAHIKVTHCYLDPDQEKCFFLVMEKKYYV